MAANWYAIVVTPTGTHVYPMPDPESPAVAVVLAAACRAHSVPDNDVATPDWDVSLTQGEPHPRLLARPDVTRHDRVPT